MSDLLTDVTAETLEPCDPAEFAVLLLAITRSLESDLPTAAPRLRTAAQLLVAGRAAFPALGSSALILAGQLRRKAFDMNRPGVSGGFLA